MNEEMATNPNEGEIIQRLDRIEAQAAKTQESLAKIKKFMFWRLMVLIATILIPIIALPFVISFFANTYLAGIESLL